MKQLFGYVIIFTLLSCNNKSASLAPFNGLTINIQTNDEKSVFSKILKNSNFVPLETSSNSLIGKISKILIYKSRIYILDSFHAKALKVYDMTGKFLYKIGESDFSDTEVFVPSDFSINYSNGEISLLNNGTSINTYSGDGKLIRNKKVAQISPHKMEKLHDGYAFIGGGRQDNLILTDSDLQVQNKYFPFIDPYVDKLLIDVFQKVDEDHVIYRRNLNDTIYTINKGSISPRLLLNFYQKNLTYQAVVDNTVTERDIAKTYRVKYFYETKDFVYLLFTHADVPFLALYSKHSKKVDVLKYTAMKNDVTFEKFGNIIVGADYDSNTLIFEVLPSSLLKSKAAIFANSTEDINQRKKVKDLFLKINLASNSVLGFTQLNDSK